MDFHIDKKMGLLLLGTFILGGVIGGLAGVTAGHEGRAFRDDRGRGNFGMMNSNRFGGDFGQEDGTLLQQIKMRRNAQQNVQNQVAPAEAIPATVAPVAPTSAPAPLQ